MSAVTGINPYTGLSETVIVGPQRGRTSGAFSDPYSMPISPYSMPPPSPYYGGKGSRRKKTKKAKKSKKSKKSKKATRRR